MIKTSSPDFSFLSFWKNKRVFISGGAGVIGTEVVNKLLEAGALIFVGDLKPKPSLWLSLAHYRQGDLISLTSQEMQKFSPEVYIHLAATFERSVESPEFWEENFHHNIALSHHLMSIFKGIPSLKTVLFASSYLIYDPSLYLFSKPQQSPKLLKEDSVIAPRNLCGMAKLLHENELLFIKHFQPKLQVVNARIFRSYGLGSRDIISRWVRALLKKESLVVFNPEGMFDYIYAGDVAMGLLSLAKTSFSGTVNLGSGRARKISDILAILKIHFGEFSYRLENVPDPYEASQADMSRFHDLINHSHVFSSLEQTIPKIIDFETTSVT